MGQVVRDCNELVLPINTWKVLVKELDLQTRVVYLRELVAIKLLFPKCFAVRRVVEAVRYVGEIAGIKPGLFEAVTDRPNGEGSGGFFPDQPLLGHREIDDPPANQNGG